MKKLLEIFDLWMEYNTSEGSAKALNGVNLVIDSGEALGLVGETGAGKTTTALSILGLLPPRTSNIIRGEILYNGVNLIDQSESYMRKIRGNKISMIFQNPLTSLNPVFTVGEQIAMVFIQHKGLSMKEAMQEAGKMLEKVGIPSYRLKEYPHEFSGGMRQRVGIAAALACEPELLIADEPTTALDVTIQAQVLNLMKELQNNYKTALLMITHNLGVVAELCQKVAVMYAGMIVEYGLVQQVFEDPRHPYTKGLIESLPDIHINKERLKPIKGNVPNAMDLPEGCKFHPRCPYRTEECKLEIPREVKVDSGHIVRCLNIVEKGGWHFE